MKVRLTNWYEGLLLDEACEFLESVFFIKLAIILFSRKIRLLEGIAHVLPSNDEGR